MFRSGRKNKGRREGPQSAKDSDQPQLAFCAGKSGGKAENIGSKFILGIDVLGDLSQEGEIASPRQKGKGGFSQCGQDLVRTLFFGR